ncbi:MAG: glycosyltransferase family 1 protein [Bacteroidales bacterium]|nr:glycosyltransferase family 1 protein [Bacteroidales bacterium]
MRILFLGEYSNLHNTLAKALRIVGHEVFVISDGDGWKGYENDVTLRRESNTLLGSIKYGTNLIKLLPFMRGFDVVQIINPVFIKMRTDKNRMLFDYLKKHNKSVFLGAFGSDYYIVKGSEDNNMLNYSEYYYDGRRAENDMINLQRFCWKETSRKELTQYIAQECNGIIACLYEYYKIYNSVFDDKVEYIPLPVEISEKRTSNMPESLDQINILIGIQKEREHLKGTDIVLPVLKQIANDYKYEVSLNAVYSLPYQLYIRQLEACNLLFDQLFSYTPAMNALIAMSKGIVVAGGGEEEMYDFIKEPILRPIINITPDRNSLYTQFENIIKEKQRLPLLSRQSIEFVEKHHNYISVAQKYLKFWKERM